MCISNISFPITPHPRSLKVELQVYVAACVPIGHISPYSLPNDTMKSKHLCDWRGAPKKSNLMIFIVY